MNANDPPFGPVPAAGLRACSRGSDGKRSRLPRTHRARYGRVPLEYGFEDRPGDLQSGDAHDDQTPGARSRPRNPAPNPRRAPKESAPAPRDTSDDPSPSTIRLRQRSAAQAMTRPPSAARLRRLALRGQGLGGARKLGAGVAGVRKTLERIGYVQIDTISVVARAHHHVLFTRVSRYRGGHAQRARPRASRLRILAPCRRLHAVEGLRFALAHDAQHRRRRADVVPRPPTGS